MISDFSGRITLAQQSCWSALLPLCAVLGYLTPRLIDNDALGDPAEAGTAYAVNVLAVFWDRCLLPTSCCRGLVSATD